MKGRSNLAGAGEEASAAPALARGPAPADDAHEPLFWTLMGRFESQCLALYDAHAPALATDDKTRFVETLHALSHRDDLLAASDLAVPTEALLAHADCADERSTLIVQGLVLEHLRRSIYRVAAGIDRVSRDSRALAEAGCGASASALAVATERIAARFGTGEPLFAAFATGSHAVIGALDGIAEPVDRIFGERFGLRFADVMGEFTADLIGACTELGMQRRKVVAHLTSACMGL